jgi:hypothetical protein
VAYQWHILVPHEPRHVDQNIMAITKEFMANRAGLEDKIGEYLLRV